MTITIPDDLEQALQARAVVQNMSVPQLVAEALGWYLQIEPALLDEFEAWQEIRDEALELTERLSS